jgi:hypothetical protein
MSEFNAQPAPRRDVPLHIARRSPLDQVRLKWQGVGNILLAFYCFSGAGGAAGIAFGIAFLLLAITTWALAYRAAWDWWAIEPAGARAVATVGAITGTSMVYLFFAAFFFVMWMVKALARNM